MRRSILALAFAFLACNPTQDKSAADSSDDTAGVFDEDGDGYRVSEGDCDDGDTLVYPSAEEICDGKDNNCNGSIDDLTVAVWYGDADEDGFGDLNKPAYGCVAPPGDVANANDCDDTSADARPGGV